MKRIIVKYESSVPYIYPGQPYITYQILNTCFQFIAEDNLATEIERHWNDWKNHRVDPFIWNYLMTLIGSYEMMNGRTFMSGSIGDIKIFSEMENNS